MIRGMAFVFLFCVDVHVKAAEICWGKTVPCIVEGRQKLESAGVKIASDASALLEKIDASNVRLVNGQIYVDVSKKIAFKTPYARVWCEGRCRGILSRDLKQVNIKSLSGVWLASRTGDKGTYSVPEGMQMSFAEVTEEGSALMEFPQSLPWDPTIKMWIALYPGNLKEFKPLLTEFREIWRAAVDRASDMHQEQAERTIASHEKELAEERARQVERDREDAQLRALFREKNP